MTTRAQPESASRSLDDVRLLTDFQADVLEALRKKIPARLNDSILGSPTFLNADAVAERMLASVPGANIWDQKIGPFYDTAGLVEWKGVSRQRIHAQMREGTILGVKTGDGELLYPSFQFGPEGETLPRLSDVLAILRPSMSSPWAQALWLNTPIRRFGNTSTAQLLRAGDPTPVLDAARRDAGSMAS